jgi:hypothetical protein
MSAVTNLELNLQGQMQIHWMQDMVLATVAGYSVSSRWVFIVQAREVDSCQSHAKEPET